MVKFDWYLGFALIAGVASWGRWHGEHGLSGRWQMFESLALSPSKTPACLDDLTKEGFSLVPRSGKSFGADVYNLDVPLALKSDDVLGSLRAALEKHLVLIVHNVSGDLTPEMHVKLTKKLGPVNPQVSKPPEYLLKGVYNSPQALARATNGGRANENLQVAAAMLKARQESQLPQEITLIVKEPAQAAAFGEGAHSDLTYLAAPPSFAVLVSRDLPPVGQGNTFFYDMRAAFDLLPLAVQERIRTLVANHTDGTGSQGSIHPVVRSDNSDDRLSLFVNRAFTRNILRGGIPEDEDEEVDFQDLLEELFMHIDDLPSEHPQAFLNVEWHPGQLVMWDNRFTQHAAQADYAVRREMHRIIVTGNTPF